MKYSKYSPEISLGYNRSIPRLTRYAYAADISSRIPQLAFKIRYMRAQNALAGHSPRQHNSALPTCLFALAFTLCVLASTYVKMCLPLLLTIFIFLTINPSLALIPPKDPSLTLPPNGSLLATFATNQTAILKKWPDIFTNQTAPHRLGAWPDGYFRQTITDDLYLLVRKDGPSVDPSLGEELQQALEIIALEIDAEGDSDGRISNYLYRHHWIVCVFLDPPGGTQRRRITRAQASKVVDVFSGLVYAYGPCQIRAFVFFRDERIAGVLIHFNASPLELNGH